jgi:tyrosyl-tRNA synthetase
MRFLAIFAFLFRSLRRKIIRNLSVHLQKNMNFIEELRWRNMLHDLTPGLEEALEKGNIIGYIGFDPTAPSLTIGNYVQIMLLKLFQRAGHKPIMVFGGSTGRIGDPSGRDKEREMKGYDELDANLARQKAQAEHLLDFNDSPTGAMFVNNLDFVKDMNVLDFLRDVGKTLTVNYMLSKDSVQKRLEAGLTFTEFSYQLLQAFDFQYLYSNYNCVLQMGGSDQWGNITSGTEFIRRNVSGKAFALTTPLLTKADGSKFGKSEKGNLWMDANMSSPYQFYQFWLRADDRDLPKFVRYFTLKTKEEVQTMEAEHANNPNEIKRQLAEEMTVRVHGQAAYEAAQAASQVLYSPKMSNALLKSMDITTLEMVKEELQTFSIERDLLTKGISIADFLTVNCPVLKSKSEVRNAIKNNAISINRQKITSHEALVTTESLLQDRYLMVESGKNNKYIVEVA